MVILNSKVNGKDLQYSVIRVGSSQSDLKGPIVANPNGTHYAAVCRTCGFAAASTFPGHAVQLLLFSVGRGDEHRHSTTAAHLQLDPASIDHVYDVVPQAPPAPWTSSAGTPADAR